MEEKNKKQGKGKIVTIIILILLVLGLSGFIVYDKVLYKYFEKKEVKEENESKEEKPIELDIDSDEVNKISDNLITPDISNESMFKNDKYSIESINDRELLRNAIYSLSEVMYDTYIESACYNIKVEDRKSISIDDLNKAIKQKYPNLKKELTMAKIKKVVMDKEQKLSDGWYGFGCVNVYFYDENTIKLAGPCDYCSEYFDYSETQAYRKIKKVEKDSNYVYFYNEIAFGKIEFDDSTGDEDSIDIVVKYYNNYNLSGNIIETKRGRYDGPELIVDEQVEPTEWGKYNNTYKTTYKLINGKYYFESIELVK